MGVPAIRDGTPIPPRSIHICEKNISFLRACLRLSHPLTAYPATIFKEMDMHVHNNYKVSNARKSLLIEITRLSQAPFRNDFADWDKGELFADLADVLRHRPVTGQARWSEGSDAYPDCSRLLNQ